MLRVHTVSLGTGIKTTLLSTFGLNKQLSSRLLFCICFEKSEDLSTVAYQLDTILNEIITFADMLGAEMFVCSRFW